MCCRGLHEVANPAYTGGFLCSGMLRVAPYCARGGVRVVSILLLCVRLPRNLREPCSPLTPLVYSSRDAMGHAHNEGLTSPLEEPPVPHLLSPAPETTHGFDHDLHGRVGG